MLHGFAFKHYSLTKLRGKQINGACPLNVCEHNLIIHIVFHTVYLNVFLKNIVVGSYTQTLQVLI